MARFFYSGDRSIENGGVFYSLSNWKWGYVDALRVTPCADAGGPDNVFWIERLSVNIRKGKDLRGVLETCGYESLPKAELTRHLLVDAHIAYGAYDSDFVATLRVGPKDPFYSGHDDVPPTHKARAGRDLMKLARQLAHGNKSLKELGVTHA